MKNELTILLIEQSKENRENYTEILELEGFIVIAVKSLISGIETVKRMKPDLIICNSCNQQPKISFEMESFLKYNRKSSQIPLIVTTTNTINQFAENLYKRGSDKVLLKPFSTEKIINSIDNLLIPIHRSSIFAA